MSGPGADGGDRLERLYERVVGLPAAEREAFLDEACADDPELRRELASLLSEGAGMEELGRLVEPASEGPPDRLVDALAHRYAIEETVGEGGMATVYRARDLRHERWVALKVLKPELAAIVGSERFLAEIRTTANLQHAAILPLFDSGEADGCLFYVMPYVEGESLRERLRREHQLPVEEAVGIAVNMAEALDYAHRQGVIHRDIKPDNVLLQEGGPVIADFGIALALSAGGGGRLTETGLSLGTPHYMSPEQASGDRDVGPATDIYALGCVLYEMLVGEPPFTGTTAQAVLGRIITGEVEPVSARRRTVPSNVDAAVEKALEKVPADRFRSAKAFAEALRSPGFGGARRRTRPGGREPPWTRLIGYGTAVALGALLTWWISDPVEAPTRPPMNVPTQLPPGQGLAGPQQLRLSVDASTLWYTGPGEEDGEWQLWAHDWSSPNGIGRPIPNTAGVYFFDPAPDNDEVAVIADGSLEVRALGSAAVRALVPEGASCCVTWSDDGEWIYFTDREGGVSRVSPRGGGLEVLTTSDNAIGHRWPAPIAGTNLVVFEQATVFGAGSRIQILDLESGDTRHLVDGSQPAPFGDVVLFTSEGSAPELRYVNRLADDPVATTIASGIGGNRTLARTAFDASSKGHLVYARTSETLGIPVWVDRDGDETVIGSDPARPLQWIRLAPDDSRLLLFGLTSGVTSTIHLKELPDGPLVSMTPPDSLNRQPFWAPDGSSIYYVAFIPDSAAALRARVEVRRMRPDGAGEPEEVGLPDAGEATTTPDGAWWVYRTPNVPDDSDLMAVRADDLESEPIALAATDAQEGAATVSRDGRWLAYTAGSDGSGVGQVYVQGFPEAGLRRQITADGGASPAFSPATDELFVVEDGWMVAYPYVTEPTFRVVEREPLFDASAYVISNWYGSHNYDVTSDGERFAMVRRLAPGGDASLEIMLRLDYLPTLNEDTPR